MWKRLTHPNVVPLLGITITPFQLISGLMPGGDLPKYIKKHPDIDRLVLVGSHPSHSSHAYYGYQVSDVAKGLRYLHSCNVVHGDLKGVRNRFKYCFVTLLTPGQPNILVDNSGAARIVDFGFTTVTQNLDSIRSASCQQGYTAQWAAPEVLNEGGYSKEADIFSFAIVMIEVRYGQPTVYRALAHCRLISMQVFTGASPFGNRRTIQVIMAITQGRRPPRPTHPTFTEDLWTLIQRCWDHDPYLRPGVSEVLQVLLTPSVSRLFRKSCIHST